MSIGDNIKKLRELKNYTQAYMAERLHMSVPGYSKIENDKTDITISKINAIAEILEADLATILNFDPKNIFNQNVKSSIVTGYNHQLTINGSLDEILSKLQSEINELKKKHNA
ncbi:MAG: helix-turn-helix transcriptional regulator [Vicingaceae bacterium]|nr:helix-turn-helix transcriptional regulator [Vicingaceae bacterium]